MANITRITKLGYSPAFDRIVPDQENLVHMLAYSIHKKRKRDFAILHKLARDDQQIKDYKKSLSAEELEDLRRAAKDALDGFSSTILEGVIRQLHDEQGAALRSLLDDGVASIRDEIRADRDAGATALNALRRQVLPRKAFTWNVGASMVATVLLGTVLTAALYMQSMNPFGPILQAMQAADGRLPASPQLADAGAFDPFAVEPAAPPDAPMTPAAQTAPLDRDLISICREVVRPEPAGDCRL